MKCDFGGMKTQGGKGKFTSKVFIVFIFFVASFLSVGLLVLAPITAVATLAPTHVSLCRSFLCSFYLLLLLDLAMWTLGLTMRLVSDDGWLGQSQRSQDQGR